MSELLDYITIEHYVVFAAVIAVSAIGLMLLMALTSDGSCDFVTHRTIETETNRIVIEKGYICDLKED